VNILWLSTIAYATFQGTPNFFLICLIFFRVDKKKLVVDYGNQKHAIENFWSPLWQLKVIMIIFFLIANHVVTKSTFGHHA
jgi:hypothetical protein